MGFLQFQNFLRKKKCKKKEVFPSSQEVKKKYKKGWWRILNPARKKRSTKREDSQPLPPHLTKVLTIYIIYHSWIHPSIILPYPPFPRSWNSFNSSHFSMYIHVYKIFPPYSHSNTLSLYLPSSHWYQSPDRTCFAFLFHFFLNDFSFFFA
jgi:hypothetical protein